MMLLLIAVMAGLTVYGVLQGLGITSLASSEAFFLRRTGIRNVRPSPLAQTIRDRVAAPFRQTVSFAEVENDPFALDLYLAGFRNADMIALIRALRQLVGLLPFALALLAFGLDKTSPRLLIGLALWAALWPSQSRKWLNGLKKARQQDIEYDLPQFLDLLTVCVEAGLNLTAAIPVIMGQMGSNRPLIQEIRVMHQEYLNGMPLIEAAERTAGRCGVAALSGILGSVVQSERMGSTLSRTLRILSSELRTGRRLKLKEQANRIPTLVLMPSTLLFLETLILALGPSIYSATIALKGIH